MSIVVVLSIFAFLFKEAAPFVKDPGLGSLADTRWTPVSFVKERYGVIPLVTGSLLVTLLATLVAVRLACLQRSTSRNWLVPESAKH